MPTGVLGFVAIWLYFKSHNNLLYSIIIGLVGISGGIILAEYIRKKYGLDNFFGRLRSTPDIDDVDPLDNRQANKIKKETNTIN